jgi:hypothetical protein
MNLMEMISAIKRPPFDPEYLRQLSADELRALASLIDMSERIIASDAAALAVYLEDPGVRRDPALARLSSEELLARLQGPDAAHWQTVLLQHYVDKLVLETVSRQKRKQKPGRPNALPTLWQLAIAVGYANGHSVAEITRQLELNYGAKDVHRKDVDRVVAKWLDRKPPGRK